MDAVNYNLPSVNIVIKVEPKDYICQDTMDSVNEDMAMNKTEPGDYVDHQGGTMNAVHRNTPPHNLIISKTEPEDNYVVASSSGEHNYDSFVNYNNIDQSQQGTSQAHMGDFKYSAESGNQNQFLPLHKLAAAYKPKFTTKHTLTPIRHSGENPFEHFLTHTKIKPYGCDQCSYRATNRSCLKRHGWTHTGELPHKCNVCAYKTAKISHFKRHLLTHSTEKPHCCTECPYRTADVQCLRTHIMIHTGEKPYACTQCAYRTSDRSSLRSHTLTHTGEKPHSCDFCPYKTSKKSYLKVHTLIHTGSKPYACDQCSYTAAQKSNLNRHKLTHSDGHRPSPKYKQRGESSGLQQLAGASRK